MFQRNGTMSMQFIKEKSISRAAEHLVHLPAVPKRQRPPCGRIRSATRIFNRNTSPLTLTECGERYIQSVEEIHGH